MSNSFKTIATLGLTQHGKSSFLNLISATDAFKVGQGDGRSCTSRIEVIKFPDWMLISGESTEVRGFDSPGLDDPCMRITDEERKSHVQLTMGELGSRHVDVLFIIQSIAEASISLQNLFSRAEAIFGPNALQSAVVILTKSDIVTPQALMTKLRAVEEICSDKSVPCVLWVNCSWENGYVPISKLASQAIELRAAISNVQPCEVMSEDDFERVCQHRLSDKATQRVAKRPISHAEGDQPTKKGRK